MFYEIFVQTGVFLFPCKLLSRDRVEIVCTRLLILFHSFEFAVEKERILIIVDQQIDHLDML